MLGLQVTTADVQDRDGARGLLCDLLKNSYGWLKLIWADGGYSGKLAEEIGDIDRHRKVKLEIVITDDIVDNVVEAILKSAGMGKIGDGKIFVYDLERAVRIRTGELDSDAI